MSRPVFPSVVLAASIMSLVIGCAIAVGPDPAKVPTEIELVEGAVDITLVELLASDGVGGSGAAGGYQLTRVGHTVGTPTPSILRGLPVDLMAVDENGKEIAAVSLFNPRLQRFHEAPARVLDTGTLVVRFEDPGYKIRFVEITVHSGPNVGSFTVRVPKQDASTLLPMPFP
ncbi:MAG: hypothetical protein AAF997_09090 [Myxococcota bacterium]